MRLTAGLDSGPVCLQQPSRSPPDDTYGSLAGRLEDLGASCSCARSTSARAFAEQDEEGVTYAEKIDAADRTLDPAREPPRPERSVRALHPHIGARIAARGRQLPRCRAGPRRRRAARAGRGPAAGRPADGLRGLRARAPGAGGSVRAWRIRRERRAPHVRLRTPSSPHAPSGAYADRALHTAAQRPRRRATARSPSAWRSARCSGAARSTGSSTATPRASKLDPASAPRCTSGSSSCCSWTASPTHAAIDESVELAKPSPGAPARQRGAAAGRSARASSSRRTTTPRPGRRSVTRIRCG